jgi:hypothetical protein
VRHLGSLVLAVIAAPLALALTGRGLGAYFDATEAFVADPLATATAVAALGLAGLVLALLTLPRFSPLGPVLAGAGYLAFGLWALADLSSLLATVPGERIGLDDRALAVTAGVCPLLVAQLLVTLFSAQRWRGHRDRRSMYPPQAGYGPPGGYPPQTGYGAPPPGRYDAPAAPARPMETTREFPAVPVRPGPTGLAREWPTEAIPTSPPPRPAPPSPSPTGTSVKDTTGPAGEDTVTEALSASGPEHVTEVAEPGNGATEPVAEPTVAEPTTNDHPTPQGRNAASPMPDPTGAGTAAAGRPNGEAADADRSGSEVGRPAE